MNISEEIVHNKGRETITLSSNNDNVVVIQNNSNKGYIGGILTIYIASSIGTWILDVGAYHHMTFSHNLSISFNEWIRTVKLGDDYMIKGRNTMQIKCTRSKI